MGSGFIARSLLYASTNNVVDDLQLRQVGEGAYPPFQSLVRHLKAEYTRQPWRPSEQGSWSGAGFLGPLLLVAKWTKVRTEDGSLLWDSIAEELGGYLNNDTAKLGATDPGYYAWHAGNVVEAMEEANITIDPKPRGEILQELVRTLPRSRDEVIWAVGTPDRERSLIANWGTIALLVLYGPHHRTVGTALTHAQNRYVRGKLDRFDDAKAAVCFG